MRYITTNRANTIIAIIVIVALNVDVFITLRSQGSQGFGIFLALITNEIIARLIWKQFTQSPLIARVQNNALKGAPLKISITGCSNRGRSLENSTAFCDCSQYTMVIYGNIS